ncbi:MAG: putative universal stress protein [Smithella sp. PtaU1.Bin162]|jgi:nucleotide-binding universal stress UspA family protein|nr:MAG: putative universal stress protein [Smithella sp. PtaU1.Bin162]
MIKYPKYKKVLFCTDFSENSDCAFDYAFGVAKRDDSILYILHIIPDIPDQYFAELQTFVKKDNIHDVNKALEKSCKKKYEKQYLSKIKDKDKVKFVIKPGREEDEILKFAKEENVDLIIIGTHGRTGVKHIFLGSVAEKVIRHSSLPVFVIPCKDKSGRA